MTCNWCGNKITEYIKEYDLTLCHVCQRFVLANAIPICKIWLRRYLK